MTVMDTARRAGPFSGNGATTDFPFDFKIFSDDQLNVLRADVNETEVRLTLDVDYSVTLNENQDDNPGGTVKLAAPLQDGHVLAILSDVPYSQLMVLTNSGGYYPKTLNDTSDKITALIQQLKEKADRTLVVPATQSKTPEQVIAEILDVAANAEGYATAAADSANKAESARSESEYLRDETKALAESCDFLVPLQDELTVVAGIADQVKATGDASNAIATVAADIDADFVPAYIDYGDYDEDDPGTIPVANGGYIKIVADNILAVEKVGENMDSILEIEGKIDGLDETIKTMDQQVADAKKSADSSAEQATAAATSAASAKEGADLAKDWAVKLADKVAGEDYSAKYWAEQAQTSATVADGILTNVSKAGESAVQSIGTAQSTAISAVQDQQAASISAVADEGTKQTAAAQAQAQAAAASATSASAAKDAAVTAKSGAEAASATAATMAADAANSAASASTSKAQAETARSEAVSAKDAAEAARDQAEKIAGDLGDPLSKSDAESTYRKIVDSYTKREVDDALNGKQPAGDYATKQDLTSGLNGKANTEHTHTTGQVNGLGALASKSTVGADDLDNYLDLGEYA